MKKPKEDNAASIVALIAFVSGGAFIVFLVPDPKIFDMQKPQYWLYHYQTLLTGFLAILGALTTVRQMQRTDKMHGQRHRVMMAVQFIDKYQSIQNIKIELGLNPGGTKASGALNKLIEIIYTKETTSLNDPVPDKEFKDAIEEFKAACDSRAACLYKDNGEVNDTAKFLDLMGKNYLAEIYKHRIKVDDAIDILCDNQSIGPFMKLREAYNNYANCLKTIHEDLEYDLEKLKGFFNNHS